MEIVFTKVERDYIVLNQSSDLVLTSIGMRLIERCKQVDGVYCLEVNATDHADFSEILRDEFIWKVRRIPDPLPLNSMAKKFLNDYHSLKPMRFLADHQIEPAALIHEELNRI